MHIYLGIQANSADSFGWIDFFRLNGCDTGWLSLRSLGTSTAAMGIERSKIRRISFGKDSDALTTSVFFARRVSSYCV